MPTLTAKNADKHTLYQDSVQCAEAECDFFAKVYKKRFDELPTLFREDFCGTSLISCDWVKRNKANHAYGVDLDQPTLDWGIRHNISQLPIDAANRIHLINDDVLTVTKPKVHVVGAFNFSYFIFKDRETLVRYYQAVRKSLHDKGLFILDAYGGFEAQQPMEEETEYEGFTYVWDQASYNPVNDHTVCHIHFKFPDGTMKKRAFTYDWRLWTLGGIQDALLEAGFSATEVHWEGTDKEGEGSGIYRKCKKAENTAGWNAYIVAVP